jgi:hypothetical protein
VEELTVAERERSVLYFKEHVGVSKKNHHISNKLIFAISASAFKEHVGVSKKKKHHIF